MSEPQACPFCGSGWNIYEWQLHSNNWRGVCDGCKIRFEAETREALVEKINRRSTRADGWEIQKSELPEVE